METEAVFTKTGMNNEWDVNFFFFFSKYKVCSNSMETEAVFTKTEMNNEWNVNFFKIVVLAINPLIPRSFSLVEALLKLDQE